MKSKFFFSVLFIAVAMNISQSLKAAVWFVKADAKESVDGSSWDSPISGSDLAMAFDGGFFSKGDIIYLSGGTYTPGAAGSSFNIKSGVTLIGGFPSDLKGTTIPELTYPTSTPTIFSGDLDNNGVPSAADIQNIIQISSPDKVTIEGVRFTCAYYGGDQDYTAGAVYIRNSDVDIKHCVFYNNKSVYYGAGALMAHGGLLYVADCIFKNNEAQSRGAAVRIANNKLEDESASPVRLVMERCLLTENQLDVLTSVGKYGAALQITSGDAWIVNSTFINNKLFSNGAGISIGNGSLNIISSTFANNTCSRIQLDGSKPYSYGASIRSTGNNIFRVANTIVVEAEDDGTKTNTPFFTEKMSVNASEVMTSGGGNIMGTFYITPSGYDDQSSNVWKVSDRCNDPSNIVELVFGTNKLSDNGGYSQTIIPKIAAKGITVTALSALPAAWGCPVPVDVTVDQRGMKRSETATSGAYEKVVSSIASKSVEAKTPLYNMGNNCYQLEQVSDVKIYDVYGHVINKQYTQMIDLSSQVAGIYIISVNGQSYKVIR